MATGVVLPTYGSCSSVLLWRKTHVSHTGL
ncbi:unnamed protein product [Ectocarpus sp. CCAP 1310/34]|nr:unnamed protein product [Ectocarpus sp. CCAP 1310/34]